MFHAYLSLNLLMFSKGESFRLLRARLSMQHIEEFDHFRYSSQFLGSRMDHKTCIRIKNVLHVFKEPLCKQSYTKLFGSFG